MEDSREKREPAGKLPKLAEAFFDCGYLLFALVSGVVMLASGGDIPALYGCMCLVLAGGDAFHLIPRIAAHFSFSPEKYMAAKGRGKQITSVTMTLFYVLLYHVWLSYFGRFNLVLSVAVYGLAAARILLCLFPQNGWRDGKPAPYWALIRNLPFIVLGGAIVALYALETNLAGNALRWVWLAVLLSFVFYLPVALFADRRPKLGMLMLPKTAMYVWLIAMGFSLI